MDEDEAGKVKICTIELGKNGLDNDYTFFTDGTVKNFYDASIWSTNRVEWSKVTDFDQNSRDRFLSNCSAESKSALQDLFDQFPI